MEYITIFTSNDRTEVSLIKHLFEDNNVPYNVLGETTNDSAGIAGSGITGMRVQVPKDKVDEAKEVLLENGFLGKLKKERTERVEIGRRRSPPVISRWILFFLAALVLIVVALIIVYFMNPDT